ncbi:hypothetical protein [Halalkalibacter okhensis]|uniref:Uncharacterized protein n=1 Tax=Halalkalibacter okhensis TaxID=333138 RepID=A0A0B0IF30_9BACI|nr:hypothetical protein [Halalkalibacter okhensis]KHF39865.1 hypothetical protein LQ50_12415 [Halalkalibacter okhensis]
MAQFETNKNENIKALKQKLVIYRKTLDALKGDNVVSDYLLTKEECNEIKKQVSVLEEVIQTMKEEQDLQINEYHQKIKIISGQVESVNDSIHLLKQDVAYLMNKVNNPSFDDLIQKMNQMIDIQNTSISLIQKGNSEVEGLKEEITQSKLVENEKKQKQMGGTKPKTSTSHPVTDNYKIFSNLHVKSNPILTKIQKRWLECKSIPKRYPSNSYSKSLRKASR